jgi:hypothetical protein
MKEKNSNENRTVKGEKWRIRRLRGEEQEEEGEERRIRIRRKDGW